MRRRADETAAIAQISLTSVGLGLLLAALGAGRLALAHAEAAGLWGAICGASPVVHCAWCGISLGLAAAALGSLVAAVLVSPPRPAPARSGNR